MCKVLKISRNAYYGWLRSKSRPKITSNKELLKARVKYIFEDSRERYGSHKVMIEMIKEGYSISRAYVGRLMQEMGLISRVSKKFKVTTDSRHSYTIAPNILNRNFSPDKLGTVWVSDLTYIRVGSGWAYLTTMIDLADRAVVGWSLSKDMTAENTVIAAWLDARATREISEDFIIHSDRGVQYAANSTKAIFGFNQRIRQSMSRKGNCWDNAVAERFFKSIKYEELNHYTFESIDHLYKVIKEYMQWYNTKRIHSSIGYDTPLERELKIRNQYKRAA